MTARAADLREWSLDILGLRLPVYEAFSYWSMIMRPLATRVFGLKLLVYAALSC